LESAAFGGLGGFGLGELAGPGLGFGTSPASLSAPVAVGGAGPGGSAAGATAASGGTAYEPGGSIDPTAGSTALTDPSSGGILGFIEKNPQLALGGGGLLASLAMGQGSVPGEKQLKGLAGEAGQLSSLSSAVLTGKLPPGASNLITNALNDTISGIKSKYASMGLSGSTMETQDIAAAQERASAQTFQLAQAITTQGLDAAGLAAQIYGAIADIQLQQDKELSSALGGFAQAGGYGAGLKSLTG